MEFLKCRRPVVCRTARRCTDQAYVLKHMPRIHHVKAFMFSEESST